MSDTNLPVPVTSVSKPSPLKGKKLKASSSKPLPSLAIDFKKAPADQIIPCSDLEQSVDLGWAVDDVRVINQGHGLYTKLPMLCKGKACFWASQCPTAPDYLFKGFPCPLQVQEAYIRFVELVQELEVQPDDNVDLDMIADLVRIDLRIKGMDMQIASEGQMTDVQIGIWQKEGKAVMSRGVHPLLAEQRAQRKDRNTLYDKLIASRDSRKKSEVLEGKRELDLLEAFAKIKDRADQKLGAKIKIEVLDVKALPAPLPEEDDDGIDLSDEPEEADF